MPFFENYIWPIMHCNFFFFEKHLYMLSCDSAQCSKKNFCKFYIILAVVAMVPLKQESA